jgi:hypothetical protein
MNQKFVK